LNACSYSPIDAGARPSFLKKEAKNFWTLARALRLARTAGCKSFLVLFFKKELLFALQH
jgi:hypothetical protein